MALVGAAAGYCFSVSLRLAIVGLSVALSLVIAQGLFLDAADALPALLYATVGGLLQAAWSLLVWAGRRPRRGRRGEEGWSTEAALAGLRANLTLRSANARHALRFGAALAAGVAAYWILGMKDHGFWIPLTILFVMRPDRDETYHRLILRALGHRARPGRSPPLLAEAFAGDDLVVGVVALTVADRPHLRPAHRPVRALHRRDHHLRGPAQPTRSASRPRGRRPAGRSGTALGIAIAFLAFLIWPNPEERGQEEALETRQSVDFLARQPNAPGAGRKDRSRL